MKTVYWTSCLLLFALISCKKEDRWTTAKPEEQVELSFTDISRSFFDVEIPLSELQSEFPFFFQLGVEDEVWERQRRDSAEIAVYDSVNAVFKDGKYKQELEQSFAYFRKYFPAELIPDVYTYSSGMQNIYDRSVLYDRNQGLLFIALDGFLGKDNAWYKAEKVYPYLAESMNPENLIPKTVHAVAEQLVPFNPRQQAFIDLMVDEGKMLIIADALLPETTDELKIGYTQEQLDWAEENEAEIWNFFVEQNLIFDANKEIREKFLQPAPYSKFGNEVETESPGRIGAWVGWQICRKYLDRHPEVSLSDFILLDNQTIFKESKYKPNK